MVAVEASEEASPPRPASRLRYGPPVEYAVVYLGLFTLGPLLFWLESRWPATARVRTRAALILDGVYWVVTPVFTGTLSRGLVLGLVGAVGFAAGHGLQGFAFLARLQATMPFSRMPWPAQFLLALLISDAIGYWSHRLRHTRLLWNLHAVHHSAEELTASAAARLHPLDEALDSMLMGVPVLLLGFPLELFAVLGPFFVLHTLLLHANLTWSFGPLSRVLASPRFHRRHHARDLPPKNFGGVFAFFDVLLGTFELPDRDVGVFGIAERDVPERLLPQLAYPFTRLLRSA